jgi:glutathione S-transferase
MLKLFHAPRTRSARVIWLLEELGDVPYAVETKTFKVPLEKLFLQDTPYGKFPTLIDGDLAMFESGAIIQYILERYGNGRLEPGVRSPLRGRYLQWLHFAESTGCTALNLIGWYGFIRAGDERFKPVLEEMHGWARSSLGVLETGLGEQDYLLGAKFSAADIMTGYMVNMAKVFKVPLESFPAVSRYLENLSTRPAFQKAMAS